MIDETLSDYPIAEPLNTEMRCGIFTNAKGEILIIYDQEISAPIQWIEYHKHSNQMFLIHENGASQDLGIPIDKKMQKNLLNGMNVVLLYLKDKKIISTQKVSLIICHKPLEPIDDAFH